ncbi:1-pyrroline-5-carboxylate dehydrogenase [Helicobacter enhydrae]|uniref:L-glutamate gamma-semialdehyde dehydrogenase n=1 Tax=Helicobacter enhydrae TaxID=222136 RepID=A0A1B1U440_9HELI|nr:bifunctional proline dehydrogenase/L-glutamate gamma-semialdehyde dehydrogenase [Helicobacter enhydrae]ANV97519.1 1-pyrroline-5-carboxylate dehydrogenase [Helicobacter enhydrae]
MNNADYSNPSVAQAIKLAEQLQNQITQNISQAEKEFHTKMQKLLKEPKSKVMLIELLDRGFRTKNPEASFDLIHSILDKYGVADFFTPFEKFLLLAFLKLGKYMPSVSIPFFISRIRSDSRNMILDANPSKLQSHIQARGEEGIIININLIGEEVLGEEEAQYRIDKYKEAICSSYITYLSIKVTTIFSQINIIDFEFSKKEVVQRLKELYALAQSESKRQNVAKFINLDMEEFRDLELTVYSFMEAISDFKDLEAGIVLQAYIPDSFEYLKILHAFSKQRVLDGGKPIKIRFVKGANMETEENIASQKEWALPTFKRKVETDSNYKKMLHFILQDDNYKYIHIGIASHNLFEIAYAYTQIKEHQAEQYFTFEMLEGMSPQACKELKAMHQLILYAPVCDDEHFNNAIAYLVRRFDENTSEYNFMRHFFNIRVGDARWEEQKQIFLSSIEGISHLDNHTRRTQNRLDEKEKHLDTFVNEADTDFILPANRKWAEQIKERFSSFTQEDIYPIAGEKLEGGEKLTLLNRKNQSPIASVYLASQQDIQKAFEVAKNSSFSQTPFAEIAKLLRKTAEVMRKRRGELLGIAALEVGKTFLELDAEVSEAIDFLEFYPYSLEVLQKQNPLTTFEPKGIVATISPWNFPIGIPVGTIAAPLTAGNKVIFKPSSLAPITGYKLCECFWEAGFSKDALIYLPSKGSEFCQHLLTKDEVNLCVLTGGEETAYAILKANPKLLLSAETGGKNATIVTKAADRDQAIKNVVHSAFSNSGQKCSATSLLILEQEVYEDENFKKTLKDAAESLNVGDPFEFKNKIAYLADKPSDKLTKALNSLSPHEYWLLAPKFIDDNPYSMAPAIKYGTKEGDFTHTTELFAPVLSVMCAKDLAHAIKIANATGYGLTGGLESLDEREWEYYLEHIEVGNVYINKPTTGAIVLRQPFGGMKKSAIGFGRKVGCFNYITQFLNLTQEKNEDLNNQSRFISDLKEIAIDSDTKEQLIANAKSYLHHYQNEFAKKQEFVKVRGEHNYFVYKSINNLLYRIEDDSDIDILSVVVACFITQVHLTLSFQKTHSLKTLIQQHFPQVQILEEDTQDVVNRIRFFERIRYSGKNQEIYQKAADEAKIIIREKPLCNGRFELLYYFNEQAQSISFHRYGNLGAQALKQQGGQNG